MMMDSSDATSIGVSSARAIAQLVRIHQHEYGMSRSHIFALYAVNLALFVLLEHQQRRDQEHEQEGEEAEPDTTFDPFDPDFVALASAFSVMTNRSALGQEVRSIFKQSIQQVMAKDGKQRGITRRLSRAQLPEELREILRDDDQSGDTEEEESVPSSSGRRESGGSSAAGPAGGDSSTDESSESETTSEQQQQEQGSMALCEMLCRYEALSLGKEERSSSSQEGEEPEPEPT